MPIFIRVFFSLLTAFFLSSPLGAHEVKSIELEFMETGGKWSLAGTVDLTYLLPEWRDVEDGTPLYRDQLMKAGPEKQAAYLKKAEATLRNLLELNFNREALSYEVLFPDFDSTPPALPGGEFDLATISLQILAEPISKPGKLTVAWEDKLEASLIILLTTETGGDVTAMIVPPGGEQTLRTVTVSATGETESVAPAASKRFGGWLLSGFRHVVPLGLDHLLFIFGLFLLVPRWKPLLGQSLLFTTAHSITLALAVFGLVSLDSRLVEILIAASIAWIGFENLLTRELKPRRLFIVFAFGLLHGLGFASVLADKLGNRSGQELALPLVGFNIGVELAQISVLAVSFLIIWPFRRSHLQLFRRAGSVFVALAGLFWFFERLLAG